MKKLKSNVVGVASHSDPLNKNGITLIALIITIIVMLILVGVTINVALNGGLFSKAEKAAYQTNASTIKEQVEIEKTIKIAENDGKIPTNHGITISSLSISDELKTEFGTKLIISNDAKLYYDGAVVTNEEEQIWLKELGITEYIEPKEEPPTLELVQIDAGTYTDHTLIGLNISFSSFEQVYHILEQFYTNNKEENGPDTFEQFLIASHNEENGTNYDTVGETGKTLEELVSYYMFDGDSITENETRIVIELAGTTFNITRPDNTTGTFTYEGGYSPSNELEGIYHYHTLCDLECEGYCYSATQIGEYEITTTLAGYEITDTITIENF